MTIGQQAFAAVILAGAALIAWSFFLLKYGISIGWDKHADYVGEQRALARINANRAVRSVAKPPFPAEIREAGRSFGQAMTAAAAPTRPRRHAVTAEHIAPVITGPFPAAVTLPPPAAARTTGELRLVTDTDRYIADMTAAEDAYRQELTTQ